MTDSKRTTKQLSSEELVKTLENVFQGFIIYSPNMKDYRRVPKIRQALQQIKSILEQSPCTWWTEEAGCVTSEDCPREQKPKPVPRAFVEKKVKILCDATDDYYSDIFKTVLIEMLTELGHAIED